MVKKAISIETKTVPFPGASMAQETTTALSPVKVCMHVLGTASTDSRVMHEATALIKAEFEVSIVDVEDNRKRAVEENIGGVRVKHIIMPSWYTSRHFQPWFFIKAVQMFIQSILRLIQTSADVYHAHDMKALPACYVAACIRRKPLIFDAHELPPEESSIVFWRGLDRVLRYFLAWIAPRCAGVITVSLPIAQEILKRYNPREVTLIRNMPPYRSTVNSDRLRQYLGLGPDVRIALYQGGIQGNRGLDRLVYAAPFLMSNIVIVLMGTAVGTTQADLEALIAREGVTESVKILPPVPYDELLEWTASADIGLNILPTDYSLSIKWCLPNKLFEYLMAGLPVLTSELEAVVDVIKTYDVGQVLPSLAPKDIGEAINRMLADTAGLARQHINALDAARNEFFWEKESLRLIHLYQSILQSGVRRISSDKHSTSSN